jgi:hypothetical protein
MTRKKFIKLAMSCRVSRNRANEIADLTLLTHKNYAEAWEYIMNL